MRSVLTASLVSIASAYRDWTGIDTKWATHPDKTAQWYEQHVGRLPELARTITTVTANESSIVKLDCVGCPFRVRNLHPDPEEWQQPAQDNSLLLNFTIDASTPTLLLNGHPIAALAPMPLHIHAFQVNANLSRLHMNKAVDLEMMDKSWNVGTKYGTFELQYEHTVVATRILYPPELYAKVPTAHYELHAEDQKLVQILLHETAKPHTLIMEDIQVVDGGNRVKTYKMECGRVAMAQTVFDPLEWDSHRKTGTWFQIV